MECREEDIYTITGYEFDWRRVGRRLLSDQKTRDIDREGGSEGDKREKMLLEWTRTKAHDATYGALVKVLRDLENNATADRVEELERKPRPSQGTTSTAYHPNVINIGLTFNSRQTQYLTKTTPAHPRMDVALPNMCGGVGVGVHVCWCVCVLS